MATGLLGQGCGNGAGLSPGFGNKLGAPDTRPQGGPADGPGGALGGSFVPRPTGVLVRPPTRAPFEQPSQQLTRPLGTENGGDEREDSEAKRQRLMQGSALAPDTSWFLNKDKDGSFAGVNAGMTFPGPGPGASLQGQLAPRRAQPMQQPPMMVPQVSSSLQQPPLQPGVPPNMQQLGPPHLQSAMNAPAFASGTASQGLHQQQGVMPAIPILLAPATRHIMPISSRSQPPPETRDKAPQAAQAPDLNRQIAMQFLGADRDTQTQMLKDPQVARAILHTLGDSTLRGPAAAPGQLGTPQALAGILGAPPATPQGLPLGTPMTPTSSVVAGPQPRPPGVVAPFVPGRQPAWSGRMVLTRSLGKHLNTQATLLHGKVQMVELALRTAAGNGGVLNISHRVPFDDLARRTPGAVLVFNVLSPHEQAQYDEYVRYFRAKMRAGVARLDEVDALYVVPPTDEASGLLKALEAAGCPSLPRNVLLGVVAATPGPTAGMASAAAATVGAAKAKSGAGVVPAGAAMSDPQAAEQVGQKDPRSQSMKALPAVPSDKGISADAASKVDAQPKAEPVVGSSDKKEEEPGDDGGGQDMSKEALLDLFSNPDLIKSLQEDSNEAAPGAD
mmetsp:Transcript_83944/g.166625  ORF Transcript_83944/g.166625 Transcript_83944/m.166625 type:complete len:616 (+) Transcript_83944:49-1896(+)